ncbi:MAG: aldo/keto reductase [Deltaproteobacteria bacterium]|nr:aldo/keto reductase [Deltaproteobacteria bacterium]
MKNKNTSIPRRRLGKTEVEVSILGLGGEGVLRTFGSEKAADAVINTALDLGVNYMESARAYAGSESYYGSALKHRRKDVFLSSKTHARDKTGALAHLQETLVAMKTDYLDLWQLHDVRTADEINQIFGPGGAVEALVEAKDKGLVRFLGVTGHHSPVVTKQCLEAFDFDTVLIPVNPAEPSYNCFLEEIVPVAGAKDVGIMAMKVYLRGQLDAPKKLLFSYALTQSVSTAVIGCDNVEQVRDNAEIAKGFKPLTGKEVQRVTGLFSTFAKEIMYYKP